MAYPNDYYETLVQASSAVTQTLKLPNMFMESVFTQFSSNWAGALGQSMTINVPVVNVSNASDETNAGVTGVAPTDTTVSLTMSHKYGSNRKIPLYEQTLSAGDLATIYLGPVIEETLRKLDSSMCADITTGNFNSYTSITGGADVFTRAHLGTAWGNLRAAGVPVNTPDNNFFLSHSLVIGNMMGTSDFSQESVVGINTAELTQKRALIVNQFNFQVIDDPYCPVNAGAYSALAYNRSAYGLRIAVPPLLRTENLVQTLVMARPNVPVVVESWFEPKDQARYIHAFIICGHGVTRKDLAQFLVST